MTNKLIQHVTVEESTSVEWVNIRGASMTAHEKINETE